MEPLPTVEREMAELERALLRRGVEERGGGALLCLRAHAADRRAGARVRARTHRLRALSPAAAAAAGGKPRGPRAGIRPIDPDRRSAGRLRRGRFIIAAVDAFTVSATIAAPRERVFEYLADIANHAEFSDHYLTHWHLLREDSRGEGAGARFRVKAPLNRFSWADMTLAEVQPPFRIVHRGRGGKYNRTRMLGVYTLSPGSGGTTRVQYTYETE